MHVQRTRGFAVVLRSILLILISLLLLSSRCRKIEVSGVSANVAAVRVVRLSGENAVLQVGFRFQNSNSYAVSGERFRYRVEFDSAVSGEGESVDRFTIEPGETTVWWGEVRMEGPGVQGVASKLVEKRELSYRFEGGLTVSQGMIEKAFEVNGSGYINKERG